jgi:hypothetical protein
VHGIVCAAILLAGHELSQARDAVQFAVMSSVDLRTRVGTPFAAEAGTVIQGADTAILTVALHDDAIRLGRAVLDSLATNLSSRNVHEAYLRRREVRPEAALNLLMVTNWGRVPAFSLPRDVQVHDFRASACGLGSGRAHTAPPSFFISTFDGRLGIDHPAWVSDSSDPTLAWTSALERAFARMIAEY